MNAPGLSLFLPRSTRAATRRARGFTLVEILTALFVMVIGISGTLAIIMRSSQMGTSASDRNNASILLPEAIDEIKRSMIYTLNDASNNNNDPHIGEYMDTVNLTGSGNPFYSVRLGNIPISSLVYPKALTQQDSLGHDLSLMYWPFSPNGSRVMGQRLTTKAGVTLGNTGTLGGNGAAYRALFKLEPHPDWVPDPFNRDNTQVYPLGREIPGSAFVGVYVLTITMYRDLNPEVRTDATPTFTPALKNVKKLQQVSDPVVVFLHDTKARN